MPRMQLPMFKEKDVQRRGKSRCKPEIAKNGPKSGSRTRARESRKRCEPESSISSSRPKKSAREPDRAWPSHARWWLTNTVEVLISKAKREKAQLLSSACLTMARLLPLRRCPRETHFVRGRRKQYSRRHPTNAARGSKTLGHAICRRRRSRPEGLRGSQLRRGHFRYADARNGWRHATEPHSRPLSGQCANYPVRIFRSRAGNRGASHGTPLSGEAMQCIRTSIHHRTYVYVAGLTARPGDARNRWNGG